MRASIAFLAVLFAFSPPARGNNEETCVEGRGATAIRACQSALSAGSTRRSVYRSLGRHLERRGKHAEAVAVYRRGLRAHPGDATLKSRLKLAQSNLEEQKYMRKRGGGSAGAAPGAKSKARFKVNKIRCKTLSGSQALAACKSALAVKPGDAVLRRRHAELSAAAGGKAVSGTVVTSARNERQHTQDAEEAARQVAKRKRQKALIANIQDRLTRLGFDPGPVDGLSGSRTRKAVDDFASTPGIDLPSRKLDQALSDALDEALTSDEKAKVPMTDAERDPVAGNRSSARDAMVQEQLASERLSSQIEDARQLAVEEAQQWERRRQQRAAAEAVLRERSRQLAKIEAEIDSRKLSATLEAQQVLERSWGE